MTTQPQISDWRFKLRYIRWWKKWLAQNPANEPFDSGDTAVFYDWACSWLEKGANTGALPLCSTPEECAAEDASNA